MKIGLFFGSFNPIHIGHLAIANYMVEYSDIEMIWFVISDQNPLKEKASLLGDEHRLTLVRKAIGGDRRFKASDIEFHLSKPSYTINTLTYLSRQHPEHEFVIVMGADGLSTFYKWKNSEELIKTTQRYVYPRPGISITESEHTENCVFVNAPLLEVSSTFIRESIKAGKDVRHFLHSKVWEHVEEMNFYKE